MISSKSKDRAAAKGAFFSWLSAQVPVIEAGALSSAALELEQYCTSKLLTSVPLFEVADLDTIIRIRVRLEEDKLFHYLFSEQTEGMFSILRYYTQYLTLREETTTEDRRSMLPAKGVSSIAMNRREIFDSLCQYLESEGKMPVTARILSDALISVEELIKETPDLSEQITDCETPDQVMHAISDLLSHPKFVKLNTSNNSIPLYSIRAYIRMLRFGNTEKVGTIISAVHSESTEKALPASASTVSDPVLKYLNQHSIRYVDNRDQGGSLWLIGGTNVTNHIVELRGLGFKFRYLAAGGKATNYTPAWYLVREDNQNAVLSPAKKQVPTITTKIKETEKTKMAANDQRTRFESWLATTPLYKSFAGTMLLKVTDVNAYLVKARLVKQSLFELNTDSEVAQLMSKPGVTTRAKAYGLNSTVIVQVLRCYRHFLSGTPEAPTDSHTKHQTSKSETKIQSQYQNAQLSKDLLALLDGENMDLLKDELIKQGIRTLEQFRSENLWIFMNRHNLYSISQRQMVYKNVLSKMKAQATVSSQQQYILVTEQKRYTGNTPAEAFREFCEYIAQKYPLKIRSLLDVPYNGTGSVVLSRKDLTGTSLMLMNPVAYIDNLLGAQAAVTYGTWICRHCGEIDKPIRMVEPKRVKPRMVPTSSAAVPIKSMGKEKPITLKQSKPVLQLSEPMIQKPEQPSVSKKLQEKAEQIILEADLDGISRESLCAELDITMVATKDLIAASKHIVSLENKLFHEEAFVDWEEGADDLEQILDKLLDKNNGYVTSTQLYEYVRSQMNMFLNDNGISSERMIYDMARHLFEKTHHHGKSLSFTANKHISRGEAVTSVLDLMKNFAREQGGCFEEEELVDYLKSTGVKTGNLRGIMRVYQEPIFLFYDEHMYITEESINIDDDWLSMVQKALDKLFADMGDHVILRDIQTWWFSMLPGLPGGREWTPLLLQSVLMHYSKKLNGVHTICGLTNQAGDTLHAMLVTADSEIQSFADAVLAVIIDDETTQREFEAEELRQLLVRRGLVAGNELIWKMSKVLANDERFVWDASDQNVRIKV